VNALESKRVAGEVVEVEKNLGGRKSGGGGATKECSPCYQPQKEGSYTNAINCAPSV